MTAVPSPPRQRCRTADDRGVHVNFIVTAHADPTGAITVTTRGASVPRTFATLGSTPAAHQLTAALLRRLHVNGGTWTSVATMTEAVWTCRRTLVLLGKDGIDDLKARDLTPAAAWSLVCSVSTRGGTQRHLRTLLADTLAVVRPDGEVHQRVLLGRSLPVDESSLEGYAPDVADGIEAVARVRVGEWWQRYRETVRTALGGDLPADWLRLPAAALLSARRALPSQAFDIGADDLAAAMVLTALLDDKGPNLSVIQSYTADSVERSNDEAAFVTGTKARNREVIRTPAPAGGLFSFGGVLEFVTAATSVARSARARGTDFDRLLFVPTGSTRVLDGGAVTRWWSRTEDQWKDPLVPRPATLDFRRLRKAAVLRGRHKGHGVIGQKPAAARLYLADALPDVILVPGLLDKQQATADQARGHTRHGAQDNADDVQDLLDAPAVMDVGVAACATNGQSPTDEDKPCGLGPAACFVCPKGYRTPEIIPGLLATVEFTENIRKYEPEEWLTGEAPVLNALARKALAQFPTAFVRAVGDEAVANSRALIACVYLEGRRRD